MATDEHHHKDHSRRKRHELVELAVLAQHVELNGHFLEAAQLATDSTAPSEKQP
jgi:hypothetical protein